MEWIVYEKEILKSPKNGVKVRFLTKEELPIFRSFMEDTSETKEFSDREDSFTIIDLIILKIEY